MTDARQQDDGESFGAGGQGDAEAGDAAAAFAALHATVDGLAADLTREMTTIRKGVEAAFDRVEQQGAPVDYGADLGRIVQSLGVLDERLRGVEQSPVLRQGAEHYAVRLERSGEGLVRTAAQALERQAADLERAGRNLAGQVAGVRERQRQNRWLAGIGGVGVVLGVLLTLFVPRALPFSAAPRLASVVMGQSSWAAGMDLMMFASPTSWNRIAAADQLVEANREAVTACREAAAKANGREQRCTIGVPAPRQ